MKGDPDLRAISEALRKSNIGISDCLLGNEYFLSIARYWFHQHGGETASLLVNSLSVRQGEIAWVSARKLEEIDELEPEFRTAAEKTKDRADKAIANLKTAARLMGLREDFFYSLSDTAKKEKASRLQKEGGLIFKATDGSLIFDTLPEIEGETEEERRSRRSALDYSRRADPPEYGRVLDFSIGSLRKHLRTAGRAKAKTSSAINGAAVRSMAEIIPDAAVKNRSAAIASLLACCGIEISRQAVTPILSGYCRERNNREDITASDWDLFIRDK